jgi:hypothetical protein
MYGRGRRRGAPREVLGSGCSGAGGKERLCSIGVATPLKGAVVALPGLFEEPFDQGIRPVFSNLVATSVLFMTPRLRRTMEVFDHMSSDTEQLSGLESE